MTDDDKKEKQRKAILTEMAEEGSVTSPAEAYLISAVHEDPSVHKFLFIGEENAAREDIIETSSFADRVTVVMMAIEQAKAGEDMSDIFRYMVAFALQQNVGIEVAQNAFQAIKEKAQNFRNGSLTTTFKETLANQGERLRKTYGWFAVLFAEVDLNEDPRLAGYYGQDNSGELDGSSDPDLTKKILCLEEAFRNAIDPAIPNQGHELLLSTMDLNIPQKDVMSAISAIQDYAGKLKAGDYKPKLS